MPGCDRQRALRAEADPVYVGFVPITGASRPQRGSATLIITASACPSEFARLRARGVNIGTC